ncbi:hypothetical protein ABIA33_004153 [Streptacidiphilus sp. MAP12-16]|uniref:hypothetical protein n=1 Tax=Streptacidiphilus sp. MAP12-16 TaxID=3156300 RepID=UPI00351928E5
MATPPPPMSGNPYAQPGNPYTNQPPQAPQQPNPYAQPGVVPQQPNPYGQQPAYGQQPPAYAPAPAAPPAQPYTQPYAQPQAAPYGQAPVAPPYGQAPAAPPYGPPQDSPYGMQPQTPYGNPAAQLYNADGLTCRFCGGFPAAQVNFHGHRGMIIVMQFLKTTGPFCNTCGTAVMREMSAKTMVRGWWGYGSWIFSSIALIRNVFAFNKVKALPVAAPGPGGRQLVPGQPVFQRPEALGLLIPFGLFLLFFFVLVVGAFTSTN